MNQCVSSVMLAVVFIGGCACGPVCPPAAPQNPTVQVLPVNPAPLPAGQVYTSQKVLAVGYGTIPGQHSQYTIGQQKLMAIRAAKVDAYRSLAEQVYGFRVWGNTAVSAFVAQNDSIRIYVDAFIRGAHLVNMTPIADSSYEATVELELTPDFFNSVRARTTGGLPAESPTLASVNCANMGCVQPSGYYYTNQ